MNDKAKLMDTPFIPAEWGHSYDLAGAEWKPEPELFKCSVVLTVDNLPVIIEDVRLVPTVLGKSKPTIEMKWNGHIYGFPGCLPLLPSPDWINAQTDPRAVAIAALERAGFYYRNSKQAWIMDFSEHRGDEVTGILMREMFAGQIIFWASTDDPALARYAVGCFAVLHKWASRINWSQEAH